MSALSKPHPSLCRSWLWLSVLRVILLVLLAPRVVYAEPRLAYVRGDTIYTARASDGRDERRVGLGHSPCISHDGRSLAYTRDSGPMLSDPSPVSRRTIVVHDLASGKETDLPDGPRHQVFKASWSPDDTWVTYNALGEDDWQVAAAHPDGSGFHFLTDTLPGHEKGYDLAGWNLHEGAVLVHHGETASQLDPATGAVAWTRPLKALIGTSYVNDETCLTISADGKQLLCGHETERAEIPDLSVMAMGTYYLALADWSTVGSFKRMTPKRFDVMELYASTDGVSIYLCGLRYQDVKARRDGIDGPSKMRYRLYRYDLRTGKLTALVENAMNVSASRE